MNWLRSHIREIVIYVAFAFIAGIVIKVLWNSILIALNSF
jgi:hypothetical protein